MRSQLKKKERKSNKSSSCPKVSTKNIIFVYRQRRDKVTKYLNSFTGGFA